MDEYAVYAFRLSGYGHGQEWSMIDVDFMGRIYLPYDDLDIDEIKDGLIAQGYLPEGFRDYLEVDEYNHDPDIMVTMKPNRIPVFRIKPVKTLRGLRQ